MKALSLMLFAVMALAASEVHAQLPRYTPPAGNPLPNALNYFRRDVGVLDPYNAFVQPTRQLNAQLQQMQAVEQANFQANQRAILEIRASQASPTGVGASFMNYSHYYRMPARGAGRRY